MQQAALFRRETTSVGYGAALFLIALRREKHLRNNLVLTFISCIDFFCNFAKIIIFDKSIVRYKIILYKKFMPPDKPLYQ